MTKVSQFGGFGQNMLRSESRIWEILSKSLKSDIMFKSLRSVVRGTYHDPLPTTPTPFHYTPQQLGALDPIHGLYIHPSISYLSAHIFGESIAIETTFIGPYNT